MILPEVTGCKIKNIVPGVWDTPFKLLVRAVMETWKTMQVIATTFGCPPDPTAEETTHFGHEQKVGTNQEASSLWLAFIVQEESM